MILHGGYRSCPHSGQLLWKQEYCIQTGEFCYALQDASRSLKVDKNYIMVGIYNYVLIKISILRTYSYKMCFLIYIIIQFI